MNYDPDETYREIAQALVDCRVGWIAQEVDELLSKPGPALQYTESRRESEPPAPLVRYTEDDLRLLASATLRYLEARLKVEKAVGQLLAEDQMPDSFQMEVTDDSFNDDPASPVPERAQDREYQQRNPIENFEEAIMMLREIITAEAVNGQP